MNITEYFRIVEGTLHSCPCLVSFDFHSEIIDFDKGFFKAQLDFYDDSKLFVFESDLIINGKALIENYRYHYQNSNGKLIFRWDNAPHFPKLKSFPHHVHIGNSVKQCRQPTLKEVLLQVIEKIESFKK